MKSKSIKFRRRLKYFFVVYFIITLILFSNYSFSRFLETSTGTGSVDIATPVLTLSLENPETQCAIDDMLPGETRECSFTVSNEEETKLSEVSLEYYFLVTVDSDIDRFKLQLKDNDSNKTIEVDDTGKAVDSSMKLVHSNKETKSYTVKIIWDNKNEDSKKYEYDDYNDYRYAGKPISLKIELKGSQIIK